MSRNPFLDLGFPREKAIAQHIRSELAARLEQHIERKGWSQTAAARAFRIPQPTISKIVNGNIDRLSIEFSIKLIVRAGLPVGITAERGSSGRSTSRRCTGHPSAAAM